MKEVADHFVSLLVTGNVTKRKNKSNALPFNKNEENGFWYHTVKPDYTTCINCLNNLIQDPACRKSAESNVKAKNNLMKRMRDGKPFVQMCCFCTYPK